MYDPNFDRTVVLMLEHTEDGALGVVLNRPSETGVDEALPSWAPVAATPRVVFVGGPVSPTGALALGTVTNDDAEGWSPVLGPLGLLDLGQGPAGGGADTEVARARLFAGHAGWTAGQLEGEVAAGGWFVVDAEPDDALFPEPERLWPAVMARQPGRLAWFANCPADPRVN
ncbi:MAG: YqgE/AlgH family protein [Acidimicrobiia bacterium]